MAGREPGAPKTGGRPAGVPNKATGQTRQAIALVAEGMAPRFQEWLMQVAEGVERSATKKEVEDGKEGPFWLVKPNPDAAANTYLRAIEYHIPKLARTEHTGEDGGPIKQSLLVEFK